ncbi:hypothetical protein G647_06424 [Cladophialophora carrionii CBS 160.54]|uniref:Histidine kinase n=1 Tax=Cladophialophora carrionii CBS 160.54 TaxID=1279043 RepID=V9D649_9EURO|nr:uncharacterized protein G647_06424 [Cladophialophora carrionii CBS 160.54]ETI22350.1 hypothetical protein G647_06424 [Cladophialophora carrionii CBS 160.54]
MSPPRPGSHLHAGSRDKSLEELGIRSFVDQEGNRQFTIQIESAGTDGSKTSQVVFDGSTGQWRVTSAEVASQPAGFPHHAKPGPAVEPAEKSWTQSLPKNDSVDWFLRSVDWSQTDYGPLDRWPVSLRTVVSIVLSDDCPAVIYWGSSLSACFNRRAHNDIRQRLNNHSGIQGRPFKEIWQHSWPALEGVFQDMEDGRHTLKNMEVTLFPQQPNGRTEESFWRGTLLPILDEQGRVSGFYNRASEITDEKVRERRSNTLYAISAPAADSNESIWDHLFRALCSNSNDFPMAFAYSAEDDGVTCTLTLKQSLGLPPSGHALVPAHVDIFEGPTGLPFYYRKLKATHEPIVLHQADGTLPQDFLEGFDWCGYGDVPTSVAMLPISVSSRLLGVLVFGLNPRRHFQAEDEAFINSLCRQVSATIALAVDREETQERAERLTLQLQESERQIREIAEHGPVGMIRVTAAGNILWANRQYFEMTGHPAGDQYEFSFLDPVHPDDRERTSAMWKELVDELKPVDREIRLHRTWTPPATAGNPHPKEECRWLMAHAFPALDNGELKSVVCCVTDISRNKWAEEVQSRLAAEATEARKLQEAFIDIVSHEMRNPLSAITQLADGIAASLDVWDASDQSHDTAQGLLEESTEYGKTILLCAAHQKRIVDDVLTLSKLDSQLLAITPVVIQPRILVESVLTMFQAEFETHSIGVENITDQTFRDHEIDYVSADPARLTQVFINLLTNAIKFTKLEPVRKITVRRSVFAGPVPQIDHIVWFPTNQKRRPSVSFPEGSDGPPINLLFSVSDTGKGLEQEEMTRLFHRFQQGTKKTHIKYGGSGLGLYISRELTEAMGGQIGLVTEPGKGSTFAFYVKAHKTTAKDDHVQPPQLARSPQLAQQTSWSRSKIDLPIRASGTAITGRDGPRLLLVEDNIINAQVLTKQLQRAGCTVYNANHGSEALEFLERTKIWHDYRSIQAAELPVANLDIDIDCILMDVEMPVLDGLTCTRRIRELQHEGSFKRHICIIAITANARTEQIKAAYNAGVDDVLPKPFRVAEVLAKVDKHVDTGRNRISRR